MAEPLLPGAEALCLDAPYARGETMTLVVTAGSTTPAARSAAA